MRLQRVREEADKQQMAEAVTEWWGEGRTLRRPMMRWAKSNELEGLKSNWTSRPSKKGSLSWGGELGAIEMRCKPWQHPSKY